MGNSFWYESHETRTWRGARTVEHFYLHFTGMWAIRRVGDFGQNYSQVVPSNWQVICCG